MIRRHSRSLDPDGRSSRSRHALIRRVTSLQAAERLLKRGYLRPKAWWSGTLVSVVVYRAGVEVTVPTVPRALGVIEHFGLATAQSKRALWRASVDVAPAGAHWEPLVRVNYDRWRAGYTDRHWYHETPGAQVALVRRRGERLASAFVEAPGEEICSHLSGEFLCSRTFAAPTRAKRPNEV